MILPIRQLDAHKGTFGTLAIFGGQINDQKVMLGSAAFVAKAAIRTGVGLVNFVARKKVLEDLIALVPQATGIIEDNFSLNSSSWKAIVIGPGLGTDKAELMKQVLKMKIPIVIDADGLNILSENPEFLNDLSEDCVLTPHPKEYERLNYRVNAKTPREFAEKTGCTLVLKGSETVITNSKDTQTSQGNNPALATGGSGDVLAGLIGGLLTQYAPDKISVFECAKLAVEIHVKAADRWREDHGSGGLIIDELIEYIPSVMDELRSS